MRSILYSSWLKRSPSAQSVVNKKRIPSALSELEFDCNHVVNVDSIFLFALSAGPWFWLCLVYHELFLKFLTLNKALLLQSWQTLYCLTLQDPQSVKYIKYVQQLVSNFRCTLRCNWLKLHKICRIILIYKNPSINFLGQNKR